MSGRIGMLVAWLLLTVVMFNFRYAAERFRPLVFRLEPLENMPRVVLWELKEPDELGFKRGWSLYEPTACHVQDGSDFGRPWNSGLVMARDNGCG